VLGPVPHDELPGLVAGAAAFAFPSTKEGFGLAAMEALAAGVPLVTRDLPVLREVFGSAARFASEPNGFADALFAAMTEDDPVARAAGRDLASRHTWAAAAERHIKLYRRLLPVDAQPLDEFAQVLDGERRAVGGVRFLA